MLDKSEMVHEVMRVQTCTKVHSTYLLKIRWYHVPWDSTYILKTQTTKTKPNQLMIWIGNCTSLQKCQDREPSRKLMALLFFTARWSMDRFSMESILNLVDGSLFTHPRLANQIWLRMKRIGPPLGVELKSHEWRNWWNMKQRWEITLIDKASNSPKQQNEKSK